MPKEQRAVVESDDPVLKVNAVAGSGRTTTLLEFAKHRPGSRILYLAYSRSVANSAEKGGQVGFRFAQVSVGIPKMQTRPAARLGLSMNAVGQAPESMRSSRFRGVRERLKGPMN